MNNENNFFYFDNLILESRGKSNSKKLSCLKIDFDSIMNECSEWDNESKAIPINNLFINGDYFPGTVKETIHHCTVIGDINAQVVEGSEKITHIAPNSIDQAVINLITREAQRSSWHSIDDSLRGKTLFGEYKKSIVLLRTYSHIISRFGKIDDITFNTVCRKLLEFSETLYKSLSV